MTDKERILIMLVQTIYHKSMYNVAAVQSWRDMNQGFLFGERELNVGDLVVAVTSFTPNDFLVGFYMGPPVEGAVGATIREIGTDRLCNYTNETFLKIDKDLIGYEILEGTQYEVYQKALKAFKNLRPIRFHSIDFDGKICHVKFRKMFSNKEIRGISFKYSKKTTIKSIENEIKKALSEVTQ